MLATSTAKKAFLARSVGSTAARSLSVLSAPPGGSLTAHHRQSQHQLQQQRTLLGFVNAIDKRVYQWAKRQMPPISKTEQIALGCGTIGAFLFLCLLLMACRIMPDTTYMHWSGRFQRPLAFGIRFAYLPDIVNVYPPFNACV